MIKAMIEWGATVTEVHGEGAAFAETVSNFVRELENGRTAGTCAISGDDGSAVIPYANVRFVSLLWSSV